MTAAIATRDHHPSRRSGAAPAARSRVASLAPLSIPRGKRDVNLVIGGRDLRLTNLDKPFWHTPHITKRDLLQYYADVAPVLLPHLHDRAMVMKRYPNGAAGEFFFMKRVPEPHPAWLELCAIEHQSKNIIDFPMIQDLAALLWVVNLGCIDLNQWYAPCDDVDRPDALHFDLDPVRGTSFAAVRETALIVRDGLDALGMSSYAKTTGSRGIHVYVPIRRGPTQKKVWGFAKQFALALAELHPKLITGEYRIAKRPAKHVLVDYNQNAWGRTLASVYSVRPCPRAPVSTPVRWEEVERGIEIDDFRLDNVRDRIAKVGDLWKPLLARRGRFDLESVL